ncbi:MAG TPA: sigma-70 family RNA polymerase sigma factor [Candidatus Dormibacteraeota bacterium]|nr:sigma-70 family RNA polymerase sigma factor [Candidatus Dormibacteraeota bacterium]
MLPDAAAPSDADLIARVVARDEAAFAALYDRHVTVVHGSVTRFLGDAGVADEVVQETYLALWQRAPQYDRTAGSVLGWTLGIARNKSIDRLRAAGRRPKVVASWSRGGEDDDDPERMLAAGRVLGSAADADPEETATRAWVGSVVRAALRGMPDADRRVLELAYDDGLSQSEIASHLGWPLGTVKSRTRRALAALRDALDGVPDLRVQAVASPEAPGR